MTPTPPRPRYLLELEALPGEPGSAPPTVRLRRLEKFLGRSWGFRCIRHVEVPEGYQVAVVKPTTDASPEPEDT